MSKVGLATMDSSQILNHESDKQEVELWSKFSNYVVAMYKYYTKFERRLDSYRDEYDI